jgi:hypothetical protein
MVMSHFGLHASNIPTSILHFLFLDTSLNWNGVSKLGSEFHIPRRKIAMCHSIPAPCDSNYSGRYQRITGDINSTAKLESCIQNDSI